MKSRAHIYMANLILNEMERNQGFLVLPHVAGMKTQYFQVPPNVYNAIRECPSYFRAGAVGPDFFPDMIMGQMTIHATDSGEWLKIMKEELHYFSPGSEAFREALAFFAGTMMHYAGDMFTHDYVNNYAKGWFPSMVEIVKKAKDKKVAKATEDILKIVRHIAVETYLDEYIDTQCRMHNIPQSLQMDVPIPYLRSCFATRSAITRAAGIRKDEPLFDPLAKLSERVDENHRHSMANGNAYNIQNLMDREREIEAWFLLWKEFAQVSVESGISEGYKAVRRDLGERLVYMYVSEKNKDNIETVLGVYDFFTELPNIFDYLFGWIADLITEPIKDYVKGIVYPFVQMVAIELTKDDNGNPTKSIRNYDEAIAVIKNEFKNVEHILRNKYIFGSGAKTLPEQLKREWGRVGTTMNCHDQEFTALTRAINMGKLCLIGADNLNQLASYYIGNKAKNLYKKSEAIWGLQELQIVANVTNMNFLFGQRNLYLDVHYKKDGKDVVYSHPMVFESFRFYGGVAILPQTIPVSMIQKFTLRLERSNTVWSCTSFFVLDNITGVRLAKQYNITLYGDKQSKKSNRVTIPLVGDIPDAYAHVDRLNEIVRLDVTVATGDDGTDGDVQFCVIPKGLSSGKEKKWVTLDKSSRNDFEQDTVETYSYNMPIPFQHEDLQGFEIRKIRGGSWRMKEITVRDSRTGITLANEYVNANVGKTPRFIRINKELVQMQENADYKDWILRRVQLVIHTNNSKWAGTDDTVVFYVILKDQTELRYEIDPKWYQNNFERNDTDTINIRLRRDVRVMDIDYFYIKKLGNDDWRIGYVILSDADKGMLLAKKEEKKTLKNKGIYMIDSGEWQNVKPKEKPVEKPVETPQEVNHSVKVLKRVKAVIHTNNSRWAGTDDDIYLYINYKNNLEMRMYLDPDKYRNNFEKNDTDKVTVKLNPPIPYPDINYFYITKFGNDDWTIGYVYLYDADTNELLAKKEEKKMIKNREKYIIREVTWR